MDSVLYWNDVALEANKVSHSNGRGEQTGPTLSSRALAIVHLAMYDAYAGARGNPAGLPPYLPGLGSAPANASPDAAVAAAAHVTLSALFPSQRAEFDKAKATQSGVSGTQAERDAGDAFGTTVAAALLVDRLGDPDNGAAGFVPSAAKTAHRSDPDNPGQPYVGAFYGANSRCFAVTQRFALKPPPAPGTPLYTTALREVRGKGIAPALAGALPPGFARRTPEETLIGVFWAYDGVKGLGTPPRLYNQIVKQLAMARGNTVEQNARLFALVNVAMADAGILAWEQKYVHQLWRPVLGVREHDGSMGPVAIPGNDVSPNCDPEWLPLGAPSTNTIGKNFTPPFPAYPSGHATFGAAAFHITRLFYGVTTHKADNLLHGMHFVSDELDGKNADCHGTVRTRHHRVFDGGLWEMIAENSLSRIFLGVHWSFDGFVRDAAGGIDVSQKVGGVPLGIDIAEDIFNNGLKRSTV